MDGCSLFQFYSCYITVCYDLFLWTQVVLPYTTEYLHISMVVTTHLLTEKESIN